MSTRPCECCTDSGPVLLHASGLSHSLIQAGIDKSSPQHPAEKHIPSKGMRNGTTYQGSLRGEAMYRRYHQGEVAPYTGPLECQRPQLGTRDKVTVRNGLLTSESARVPRCRTIASAEDQILNPSGANHVTLSYHHSSKLGYRLAQSTASGWLHWVQSEGKRSGAEHHRR